MKPFHVVNLQAKVYYTNEHVVRRLRRRQALRDGRCRQIAWLLTVALDVNAPADLIEDIGTLAFAIGSPGWKTAYGSLLRRVHRQSPPEEQRS